jgi:predicted Rossmann fold flavoprotein
VEIRCRNQVRELGRDEPSGSFRIVTNQGNFVSHAIVIATGGLSIPTLGATDFGYRIARQFGLQIERTRPGLVPFTLERSLQNHWSKLSGVAVEARVSCGATEFRENLLITHRGLSGPAILQISNYWQPGALISIDLLPDHDLLQILLEESERGSRIELANLLARYRPRRFVEIWCGLYAESKPLNQYNRRQLVDIAQRIHQFELRPNGTEGFRKAEVTAGGVATTELSSQTMEARRVPGLFFIGEVVDVTGQLGGYNFQWAWASGYAAGQAV